jgi:hypothetical protein
LCDAVVGDAYAHLLAVLEYLGQTISCRQDKGEGGREVVAHEAEGVVVDTHIFAHTTDIVCHYGEQMVFGV